MKPILYKANEADFTTLGLGVLADELQTLVTEERNGQFYLEMDYPIDGIRFKELKNDRIIKAHASNNLKNQRFKIIRITKPAKGVVKVYAEHVSNHTSDLQIKPNASYSGTASQALNVWESNIVDSHPFSVYSDITTTGSGRWSLEDVRNARQALGGIRGSILDTYGGEYLFDNYRISLLKQRGDDNGLPIMYGKNLIDLEQEEEIASTYTSIFPYSIYMPEREEGQTGEIEPVEVTLPEYFIDSEHVDKYSRRKILKVDFSSDKIKSVEALRSRAQRYITENDIGVPKVNLRVKFVDLAKTLDYKDTAIIEEVNLCDWVVVYFEEIGIQQRAKVIKTVWNVGLDRYEEIEIGETRSSLTQSIHNVVDNRVDEVEKEVNEVRNSANGKNRNHYGPNEPPAEISQVGDTWFRPIGDGETEIYRYNGHMWELVLDTSDTTKNAREIEEKQKLIDEAKEVADQAANEINIAIANAGFSTLSELTESLGGRTSALDVKVGSITGIVTDHTGRISAVEQTAAGLQTTVASKANQSQVTQLATLVSSKVSNADFTSQIGQLSSAINLRVTSTELNSAVGGKADKSKLITQINLSPDTALIQSENILLDGDVTIRGTAWMDGAVLKDLSVDGAKIQDATIGSAKIANLDVSKITGEISSFIQTYWNGISSRMSADSSGLKITTTDAWDMCLNDGGVEFTDKFGKPSGRLRATLDASGNPEGTLLISERGYKAGLGRRLTSGLLRSSLTVDGNTGSISVASDIGSNSEIRAPEFHIGQYNRLVRYVGGNETTTAAFEHRSSASRGYDHTTDRIWLVRTTNTMTMYADINMNGQTISNQSDIRLKKNITDSGVNALKEIERLNFVNFEWDETKGQDLKPKGVQFGIIAQHSPFLQMKTDDEESYLSVDMSKQVNLNSKASQELLAYTRSLEKRIEVLESERASA